MLSRWTATSLKRANAVQKFVPVAGMRGMSDATSRLEMIKADKAKRTSLKPLKTKQHGVGILHDPLWNKGMAMSVPERDRHNLRGLLPPIVKTLEQQKDRIMKQLRNYGDDNVRKNMYLQDLHNRNETLYHRVLVDHIEEVAPLVYTPTVGHVCQQFGNQFRRARGMYFSREDRGHFSSMVWNWPHDDVHVIVVTDGSRILGLGDLGAHGMGIPIGKLALYCAAGGIAPHRVMPVMLDVGTNNEALRDDEGYIGIPKPRLEGQEYYDMVDEFMTAVFDRWPNTVVQFEDFESSKAMPLLAKYRHKYRCFNDDIQGTGCVTLAGVIAAARQANVSLTEMSFLCAGAGSAGIGVCAQIVDGMVEAGLSRDEAMKRFVICTSVGAIGKADGKFGDPNASRGLSEERALWYVRARRPPPMALSFLALLILSVRSSALARQGERGRQRRDFPCRCRAGVQAHLSSRTCCSARWSLYRRNGLSDGRLHRRTDRDADVQPDRQG